MSFVVGATVGSYRIVEQLGQGGMATVFKAYHAALDRFVALKVLHPAFMEDPNFLARFQREARVVARLEHSNIVPVYDFSEHEGRPYLVMKYIQGETLKARIQRRSLNEAEILAIINSVGSALSYAHDQGILHRDVKPSNVLLSNDGRIFLADFGLAKIAQSGESTLTADMMLGTPQYISPEQALGKKELDAGTDIYSTAVMLYELVVGRVPFNADTPFSIIHDHIYTPLPMPRKVNPLVDEKIERVLLKALAKDSSDRYPDIKSLVDAINLSISKDKAQKKSFWKGQPRPSLSKNDLPTLAADHENLVGNSLPGKIEKPARKKRTWIIVGAALMIFCCILLAIAQRNQVRRLPADAPLTKSAAQETRPADPTAMADAVSTARQAVYAKPDDPWARIDLSIAYTGIGEQIGAMDQVNRAILLAGNDQKFLLDAGNKLVDNEFWIGAANVFIKLAQNFSKDQSVPQEVRSGLGESVYRGFTQANAPEFLSYETVGRVDEALMILAKSRHTFYHQNKDEGMATLEGLFRLKPDLPEGLLSQADFFRHMGEKDRAEEILAKLEKRRDVPLWVRAEIRILSSQMKP